MKLVNKTIFELKASYYCNLDCKFCVFSGRKGREEPLTGEAIRKAVGSLRTRYPRIDYFVISGGEPTIRKDFWEILQKVKENLKPEKIILHTNGLRVFSPSDFRRLLEAKVVVFLSFHTLSPQTYRRFTGVGVFDKVNRNLDSLVKAGVDVFTNTIIMRPNQSEIVNLGMELGERGVKGMEFRLPFGTRLKKQIYPWIIPDDWQAITDQLIYLIRINSQRIDLFFHPSVPCTIKYKYPRVDEKQFGEIYVHAKKSLRKNVVFFDKRIRYLFLDPRMKLMRGRLQQEAINQGEDVFVRLSRCQQCDCFHCCLGIPREFAD